MAPETQGELSKGQRVALRSPRTVMRLERMGCFHATRLSFMPTLIRRMSRECWSFASPNLDLDADGYGTAIYSVSTVERTYSLIVFSTALDPQARSDRVIAEAWDATFTLFDGVPGEADIERLRQNVPRQEAGRFLPSELVLSRANRSVRFFEHVVECLAAGRQPDTDLFASVGYLMRTTAVYGNGKFGIADRAKIEERRELSGAFQAEMLCVYLIRCFSVDLVEHVARCRDPVRFAPLAPRLKRHLGIGNATGLGMAPFLLNHPILINNWIVSRETALARVRSLTNVTPEADARFRALLARARRHVGEWGVEDVRQMARIDVLRDELARIEGWVDDSDGWRVEGLPWDALYRRVESRLSIETQELLVSLLIEPYDDLVDDLADCMVAMSHEQLDPAMTVGDLRMMISRDYDWALSIDFSDKETQRRFWYVSEEKLEPRVGDRYAEAGADKEMPLLAVARDVQVLAVALAGEDPSGSTAAFVMRRPEYRHLVRRVQSIAKYPYGEIRDNLTAAECLPIDLLRCKLSFFGASKFDPKSDRWTRITMFQGAPFPDELDDRDAQDWMFPTLGTSS